MKRIIDNQRGAFVVIFALSLLVLLGFVALGIEAGRWYLVRAELAKGVDAACLEGAKNISNPFVAPTTLAEEFGRENFEAGYVGTPASGAGSVRFTATMVESDKISVTGNVNATATLARIFGIDTIPVAATGVAQKKEVEIMMILDRSGSMAGTKMTALKNASKGFLDFFADTQDKDKVGLISFATTAGINLVPDRALATNFVTPMKNAINNMTAVGATNTEDAVDMADGTGGFTDQTGVPGDRRIQQFVVFFSDGMPTALRDQFKYNNTNYDGVVYGQGSSGRANCRTSDYPYMSVYNGLTRPNGSGDYSGVNPATTGDGKATSGTTRTVCASGGSRYLNTKWYLFETTLVPRSGGGTWPREQCSIPMSDLLPYFCGRARQLALNNAQVLKDKGIKVYVIGLGSSSEIDPAYLRSLSSGTDFTFIAPTSADLEAIFNKIAKDIKLRLVY
jgi:Mg-chelatase subunit ChlD